MDPANDITRGWQNIQGHKSLIRYVTSVGTFGTKLHVVMTVFLVCGGGSGNNGLDNLVVILVVVLFRHQPVFQGHESLVHGQETGRAFVCKIWTFRIFGCDSRPMQHHAFIVGEKYFGFRSHGGVGAGGAGGGFYEFSNLTDYMCGI